ncbi:TetR/AcrR family transcriptional regulator [Shewanella waksmanii]|uniref:TetR/AcrR family transcriptional regulator n=1 Tax=Shewanella waksmanii TaxID=213783 RepID=UPI00048A5D39|nr:TetR/AcrR family transcriptional regulator [Shewanella waksmanii]
MTVNTKKRGRPSAAGQPLNQQRILEHAKQLLLEQGKVPSIRQLAAQLQVDAMAIYHYFDNKNSLLEALAISLVDEVTFDATAEDWRAALLQLCQRYLVLLDKYAALLETLLTMKSTGPAEVFSRQLGQVLRPLQLGEQQFNDLLCLLADYLHGFALAMRSDTTGKLTVEQIQGPITLICRAITLEH